MLSITVQNKIMQLFYSDILTGEVFTFDENESKHIIKVLRHKQGDVIHVTDGAGKLYKAGIVNDDPRKCMAEIKAVIPSFNKHNYYLHIAVAPTKNADRMEWFVEKSVELGIDEITPLICKHSERRRINTSRLRRVMLSAMKQSFKVHATKINEAVFFTDLITNTFEGKKYIAHLDSRNMPELLSSDYSGGENSLILIGPEGDFSDEEVNMAIDNNFISVSLGNSRLRTETAGITACCWIYLKNQ